ncbi:Histidine acid phosphatase [Trichostrongylus colubriformis]|uniref:Histidine acid phosphatase n=1 Tax=Trichostrongylus colubriformis TaxID=6319 RepID=A0AAN8FN73_TRICO
MTCLGQLLISNSLLFTVAHIPSSTLQFAEFWFRHGERTPTHYMYFPNESPSVRYVEAEPGELTNRGIQQAYQRGQFIRMRYSDFLTDVYRPSKIHAWTGNDNRTVTSAQAVLAAIYKPNKDQTWSSQLNWQPVAVHTDPTLDWVSTGVIGDCTEYEKTFVESPQYKDVLASFDPKLIHFLENNTGVNIATPEDFNHVIDSLVTKLVMSDERLPYPAWAEPIRNSVSRIRDLFHQRVIDAQKETAGQYHSEMLLSFIEDHLNRPNSTKNKAVFMSGHDSNFMALGRQLNITPMANELVPYAALLTVELHLINGTYFVERLLNLATQDLSSAIDEDY